MCLYIYTCLWIYTAQIKVMRLPWVAGQPYAMIDIFEQDPATNNDNNNNNDSKHNNDHDNNDSNTN